MAITQHHVLETQSHVSVIFPEQRGGIENVRCIYLYLTRSSTVLKHQISGMETND
jgi:hypothetical protein